jgi:malic enzyme
MPKPGKIEVVPTKPSNSQRDLSIAYSPGVADPCMEIAANPEDVYKYTAKGNLVAGDYKRNSRFGIGRYRPGGLKTSDGRERVYCSRFSLISTFLILNWMQTILINSLKQLRRLRPLLVASI